MTIKLENSSSSNKVIPPTDFGAIRFSCPNCGDFIIIRSSQDRNFGNRYVCHKCGFVGP
jgi:predicted RNA-binding Zn-ribbon protein involved in translation (DUF1610 family)